MPPTPATVTFGSVLQRSADVLYQEVGGEAVLLDLASEQYYGLDPVGNRIWGLVDGEATLGSIHATLIVEYDADPGQIGEDLLSLVQSLAEAGLVRVN